MALKPKPAHPSLFLPVMILTLHFHYASSLVSNYSINEELPVGTRVGFLNVGVNLEKPTFYFRPKDGLFRFDDVKPMLIITNSTIDKEQLCPYEKVCSRTYDIMTNTNVTSYMERMVTKIVIFINDMNDNSPRFPGGPSRTLFYGLSESAQPGITKLKLPAAEDEDYGSNGDITYSFLSSKSSPSGLSKFILQKYDIDDVSHNLMLQLFEKLDRETENMYNLTIVATDGGSPGKSSSLDIVIKVTDVNDNAPQFEKSTYTVPVDEDLAPGQEVITLKASDSDEGENARLNFAWSDDTSRSFGKYFSIDSETGTVKLQSKLDREEQQTYYLTAVVSDNGDHPLSSHTLVIVNVKDVNDNSPTIVFRFRSGELTNTFQLRENSPHGISIGRVIVTDMDQGANARVMCTVQPPLFFLLPLPRKNVNNTGVNEFEFMTGSIFDRENTSQYEALVTCKDAGRPQLQTTEEVMVKILDENDNAPSFEKNVFRFEVEENVGAGSNVFQIKARDLDEGNNAKLSYILEPQQPKWQNIFTVDENGNVITLSDINCEEYSQMLFLVRAIDCGEPSRTGEARMEVTVRDKDEHTPIFDRTSYEFAAYSKIPENFLIGQVRAIDEDCSTRFGSVIYKLDDSYKENIEQLVYIDRNSGAIRARIFFNKNRNLRFSVVAGNPSGRWFSDSKVDVSVKILVEEPTQPPSILIPVFHFPNENNNSVQLHMGSENGTLVCQLQVTNGSLEKARKFHRLQENKGVYRFKIISGNEAGLMSIDEITGRIKTTTALNTVTQITLNVSAYNSLNPIELTMSLLVIHVSKHEAVSSDLSIASSILDHSILIAILLACSAFLTIFCATVFVIRCHLSKRNRRPRRYNCRLETVKAASNCSLNRASYLSPESNGGSTLKDITEQNSETTSSIQKFNNKFVSFNVDDDLSCHMADSRTTCPFKENCALHKPFVTSDFDDLNYLNERDFYNLPVFSTQTTSLYSTQKSFPEENQFKSFKPLRMSPMDRAPSPSTSAGFRQLSPASFFPITCSGHIISCQPPPQTGFNYINNNNNSKGSLRSTHERSHSSVNRRHSESQI